MEMSTSEEMAELADVFSPWNESNDFSLDSDVVTPTGSFKQEEESNNDHNNDEDDNKANDERIDKMDKDEFDDDQEEEEDDFDAFLKSEEDALFLEIDSASLALMTVDKGNADDDVHMATQKDEDNEDEKEPKKETVGPSLLCFHTASGSEVRVSDKAIKRARSILKEQSTEQQIKQSPSLKQDEQQALQGRSQQELEQENHPLQLPQATAAGGEQRGEGEQEHGKERQLVASKESRHLKQNQTTKIVSDTPSLELRSSDLRNDLPNNEQSANASLQNDEGASVIHGFRTASGTSVVVSTEALERARRRFEESEKENSANTSAPLHLSKVSATTNTKSITPMRMSSSRTPLSSSSSKTTPLSSSSLRTTAITPSANASLTPSSTSSGLRRMSLGMRRRSFISPTVSDKTASPVARPQSDQRMGARSAFRPPQMKRARREDDDNNNAGLTQETTSKLASAEDDRLGSHFGNSIESQDFEELMRNLD